MVLDYDRSAASRDFVARLQATGFYDMRGEVRSYDEIGRALRAGRAKAALIFPARWGADAGAGRRASLQLVIDGSDPQTVGSALDTATGLAQSRASDLLVERLARAGVAVPAAPIAVEPITWYNPDLKTSTFVVPGLVGVILTMTMVMLTAMAVARERERGTLEQLIVSPLKPAEMIIGKIVPYIGIGYVQMTLVLLLGKLAFGVPFVGIDRDAVPGRRAVHRREPGLGLVFSTIAQDPAAGDADELLLPAAEHLAVGLRVPVGGDAGAGADAEPGAAADPFPAHRARRDPEGQRLARLRRRAGVAGRPAGAAGAAGVAAFQQEARLMARPRGDISERLIKAAREAFLTQGVDGASLREIAAEAGTSLGMITYYFPTKDDLFLAVLEQVYPKLLADLARRHRR